MDLIRYIQNFLRRNALFVTGATLFFAVVMLLVTLYLQAKLSYPKDGEFTDLQKIENMEDVCRKQYPDNQYEFIKLDTNHKDFQHVIPAYRVRCIVKELSKNYDISVTQQPLIGKDMNLDCYCEKKPYEKGKRGATYTRAIFLNYRDANSWFCIKDNSEKKISYCKDISYCIYKDNN